MRTLAAILITLGSLAATADVLPPQPKNTIKAEMQVLKADGIYQHVESAKLEMSLPVALPSTAKSMTLTLRDRDGRTTEKVKLVVTKEQHTRCGSATYDAVSIPLGTDMPGTHIHLVETTPLLRCLPVETEAMPIMPRIQRAWHATVTNSGGLAPRVYGTLELQGNPR